ncbi:31508_t:CDS:2 [Gigaspora margarita]|uniref:31508_t:CDS:1 n=1 Tax=Gigaspora margarita TaxID=4874 RepID=A0ABN7VJ35_GIGMA|nr:31508_t:CDS:2 [Gigaspora margarita]
MERLEALAVLDKFASTRQKKFVPTLPIIRGVNDGSKVNNKELFPFVETEVASENLDQPLAETIRQHIDYPSPPIECNSFFTRKAYERYSFFSFRRKCEIFSMYKEKNIDISVQKSDNVDNIIGKSQINEQIKSPFKSDDDLVMDDQCSEDESNETNQKMDIQVEYNSDLPTLEGTTDLTSIKSPKTISSPSAKEASTVHTLNSQQELSSLPTKDESSKIISEKKSEEVESQESVDVIGPFLQLLDQKRKQLEKSNAIQNATQNATNSAPISPFYCFEFLRTGNCTSLDCSFPHLTKEECEEAGFLTNYCFVFADTGKCDNRNCHHPHIFRDELEKKKVPISSKHKAPPTSKKSAKKKKSNTPDDLLYIANNIIATENREDLDDMI